MLKPGYHITKIKSSTSSEAFRSGHLYEPAAEGDLRFRLQLKAGRDRVTDNVISSFAAGTKVRAELPAFSTEKKASEKPVSGFPPEVRSPFIITGNKNSFPDPERAKKLHV